MVPKHRVPELLERVKAALALRPLAREAAKHQPWSRFEDFVRAAGYELDDWQMEAATSTAQEVALNCTRQAGKSTGVALMAGHTALTEPGTTQIITGPGERQAKELLMKASDAVKSNLKLSSKAAVDQTESDTATQLLFKNGSRILALPGSGKTIRTYAVRRLIVEEAAFTEDELITAVRPMLAVSRGQLVSLSTPNGKQGWWYKMWTNDDTSIHRIEVPWWKVPRIDHDFIAKEKARLSDRFYQEYECQFLEGVMAVFRETDIERIMDGDATAWEL